MPCVSALSSLWPFIKSMLFCKRDIFVALLQHLSAAECHIVHQSAWLYTCPCALPGHGMTDCDQNMWLGLTAYNLHGSACLPRWGPWRTDLEIMNLDDTPAAAGGAAPRMSGDLLCSNVSLQRADGLGWWLQTGVGVEQRRKHLERAYNGWLWQNSGADGE